MKDNTKVNLGDWIVRLQAQLMLVRVESNCRLQ
jgi:hypothetical protein